MSPEEIKALRKQLGCTARELATALKIDASLVVAWEAGERFPTKRHVHAMASLRDQGAAAFPKGRRHATQAGLQRLADPNFWELVRKLAQHPALFERVSKLAQDFPDPAAED